MLKREGEFSKATPARQINERASIAEVAAILRRQRYPSDVINRLMDEYEAVFEIDSKTDAYAVERLMSRLYDTVREEAQTLRAGSSDAAETIEQFEAMRDAAQQTTPGKLTVIYESRDEGFED